MFISKLLLLVMMMLTKSSLTFEVISSDFHCSLFATILVFFPSEAPIRELDERKSSALEVGDFSRLSDFLWLSATCLVLSYKF